MNYEYWISQKEREYILCKKKHCIEIREYDDFVIRLIFKYQNSPVNGEIWYSTLQEFVSSEL